ncbi:calreticulin 3 [Phlyctochytrium bullatum]|nr:calreticulin 3 [Phlyctochytrium bullatum]
MPGDTKEYRRGEIGANGSPVRSPKASVVPAAPSGEPKNVLTLIHLGRRGGSYSFSAESESSRNIWRDHITRQRATRMKRMKFEILVISDTQLPLQCKINCSSSFMNRLLLGTDNGLYLGPEGSLEAPVNGGWDDFRKVIELENISQVEVLRDYDLLLVLSDVFDASHGDTATAKKGRKIADAISFVKSGICADRALVCARRGKLGKLFMGTADSLKLFKVCRARLSHPEMNVKTILAVLFLSPAALAKVYFQETFSSIPDLLIGTYFFAADAWKTRWVQSESKSDYGEFKVTAGKFFADETESRGLQTSQDARFYAISAPLDSKFDSKDKDLVVQFTAKFEQNIDCGGGYIKLLPKFDPKTFNGDTTYNIMFGPDICGYDKKIHVILNYKDKNHLITKKLTPGSDQLTHQYTLIIHPDQTYEVLLDNKEEAKGSIIEDWDILPPKTIKDPEATKPKDWVDEAKIPDPEDKKPEGYDDIPEYIPDPDATKPEDWDDDMDGEWEAPKIKNPDFKGTWKPKMIDNPAYKVEDKEIYRFTSEYVGFDLWQVKSGTIFDNIIVTDSVDEAKEFSKKTFESLKEKEKEAKDKLDAEEKAEAEKKAAEAKEKEEKKKEDKDDEKEPIAKRDEEEPKVEEVDALDELETPEETPKATPEAEKKTPEHEEL